MYKAVVDVDPDNAKIYTRNYNGLMARLDSIDSRIDSLLSHKRGTAFMVWHPSLSYFARDYGLEQISIGVEGKEVSVQLIQEKIDEAKAHKATVFFTQKDFDSRQAAVISRETDADVIAINPLNYEWEKELYEIAVTLASK
jgi:zinc transport system substrate-binding protein